MPTVFAGLSSWIIQDENYGDFQIGREYQFALEFAPTHLSASADLRERPGIEHAAGAQHDVRGVVLYRSPAVWVVDFGVPAYAEAEPPDWAHVEARVKGTVYIGVDPFMYSERLRHEPGMPRLSRTWLVKRILLETTPWVESIDSRGRKLQRRVSDARTFRSVPSTDAWNDDGGNADYVLECELQPAG